MNNKSPCAVVKFIAIMCILHGALNFQHVNNMEVTTALSGISSIVIVREVINVDYDYCILSKHCYY